MRRGEKEVSVEKEEERRWRSGEEMREGAERWGGEEEDLAAASYLCLLSQRRVRLLLSELLLLLLCRLLPQLHLVRAPLLEQPLLLCDLRLLPRHALAHVLTAVHDLRLEPLELCADLLALVALVTHALLLGLQRRLVARDLLGGALLLAHDLAPLLFAVGLD